MLNSQTLANEVERKNESYLEQSMSLEMGTGKEMPQLPGRPWAAASFVFIFSAAVLIQAQMACLLAVDVASEYKLLAPAQQSAVGIPPPFCR